MSPTRRLALSAGLLYLVTVVTSIPALALKAPVLADPAALTTDAGVTALRWAAALEVPMALACVGTAVTLFPLVRRAGEPLARGFVASRTVEASLVMLGVVAMLAASGSPTRTGTSQASMALVSLHDWAFLAGPGFLPAINALLLAPLVLRARLTSAWIPLVGLVGAPLLIASAASSLFGLTGQVSTVAGVLALPVAVWEISLGLYLTFRGVRYARPTAEQS